MGRRLMKILCDAQCLQAALGIQMHDLMLPLAPNPTPRNTETWLVTCRSWRFCVIINGMTGGGMCTKESGLKGGLRLCSTS